MLRPARRVRGAPFVISAAVAAALVLAASATAAGGPGTGMWIGSADGTTVTFVVSHVGDSTVLSDLTVHCADAFGAAGDDGAEGVRHEAAIDPAGLIREEIEPKRRRYQDSFGSRYKGLRKGITGQLGADGGTVSVNGYLATGPDGFSSATDTFCPGTEDLAVEHVSAHLMEDGEYEMSGAGVEATVQIYGRGALFEWRGDFRTPIGADPEPGTDTKTDKCHRSTKAYSQLLELPGVRLKRSFFACSGATTDDVLERQRSGEPPQVDRPQLRGADLVTISIGGNDALFSKVVAKCTRVWPVPCYRGGTARKIRGLIGSLGPRLTQTYERIKGIAGKGAKLIVLGYPNLMPRADVSCGKLRTLFSAPARKFMRELGGQLSGVIAAAAQKAGVRYLDVRQAFADHEFCSQDEWIHFIVRDHGAKPSTASFHPTGAGQAAYARVLERALR